MPGAVHSGEEAGQWAERGGGAWAGREWGTCTRQRSCRGRHLESLWSRIISGKSFLFIIVGYSYHLNLNRSSSYNAVSYKIDGPMIKFSPCL